MTCGGAAALVYFGTGIFGGACVGGVFAVVILRDIGYFRRTVSSWSVLREVLDWNKIEKLLAADRPGEFK
ncbi:MAG: hypothetical protein ACFUZC_03110 [Chthoniobacteraceae bacterium]